MVFLVLEPEAVAEVIAVARQTGAAVWIGSDAMAHDEHRRIVGEGVNLTQFTYPLSRTGDAVVEDALSTVVEHHPGETIWVQRAP